MHFKSLYKFIYTLFIKKSPDSSKRRDISIRKFQKHEYMSLSAYLRSKKRKTELSTIWLDDIPLDIIFQYDAPGKPLLVFFHGAVDQEKTIIPHYVGLSYKRSIAANLLHIADPSLIYERKIRSGWYLGSKDIQLQEVLIELINNISENTQAGRVVLFGSSGGGYPSLSLVGHIENSIAVVNSPATSVLNNPRRSTFVRYYLEGAFGALTAEDEEYILKEKIRSDLQEGFNVDAGSVVYMLNINDKHSIKHHAKPFFDQFSQNIDFKKKQVRRIENIYLIMDDWGEGHRYPPASLLLKVLRMATNTELDFKSELFMESLSGLVKENR